MPHIEQNILDDFIMIVWSDEKNTFSAQEIQKYYDDIVINKMNDSDWQEMINAMKNDLRFEKMCDYMQKIHEPSHIMTLMSVYAISGLVTPIHSIGTGILIAFYNPNTSSLAISTWGICMGTAFGFVNSVSLHLKRDVRCQEKMDAVIKIASTLVVVCGITTSATFWLAQTIMPSLLPQKTGQDYSDFFQYFKWSPMGELASMILPTIIFKRENNYQIQLCSTVFYRLSAVGMQYYFAKKQGMGIAGVGLGGTVAAWTNTALLGLWFLHRRSIYAKHSNFCHIAPGYLYDYVIYGLKLALQRLVEWINLFSITFLLSRLNSAELFAAAPSVQMTVLAGLINQYMGMLTMMRFEELSPKYKNLLRTTNLVGALFNLILTTLIISLRQNIIAFILGNEINKSTNKLANTLLLIAAMSLIPDGVRLITAGILRGKNQLVFPSLASLTLMSLMGVSIGALVGNSSDAHYATPLFALRTATVLLSAIVNYELCQSKIMQKVSLSEKWFCLNRSAPVLPITHSEINISTVENSSTPTPI